MYDRERHDTKLLYVSTTQYNIIPNTTFNSILNP